MDLWGTEVEGGEVGDLREFGSVIASETAADKLQALHAGSFADLADDSPVVTRASTEDDFYGFVVDEVQSCLLDLHALEVLGHLVVGLHLVFWDEWLLDLVKIYRGREWGSKRRGLMWGGMR